MAESGQRFLGMSKIVRNVNIEENLSVWKLKRKRVRAFDDYAWVMGSTRMRSLALSIAPLLASIIYLLTPNCSFGLLCSRTLLDTFALSLTFVMGAEELRLAVQIKILRMNHGWILKKGVLNQSHHGSRNFDNYLSPLSFLMIIGMPFVALCLFLFWFHQSRNRVAVAELNSVEW